MTDQSTTKASKKKLPPPRRPGRPWLLLAGLAVLSLAGWLRLEQAVFTWQWLVEFSTRPGPLYQAVSGAVWGLAGMVGIILTWLRRRWSIDAALGIIVFFAASYWLDRTLLSQSVDVQANTVFMGIATLACLVYAWAVLWLQKDAAA